MPFRHAFQQFGLAASATEEEEACRGMPVYDAVNYHLHFVERVSLALMCRERRYAYPLLEVFFSPISAGSNLNGPLEVNTDLKSMLFIG